MSNTSAGGSNNLYALLSVQDSVLHNSRVIVMGSAVSLLIVAYFLGTRHGQLLAAPFSIISLCLVGIWLSILQSRLKNAAFVEQLILWSEEGKHVLRPFTAFREFRDAALKKRESFVVNFVDGRTGRFDPTLIPRISNPKSWRTGGFGLDLIFAAIFLGVWIWKAYEIYGRQYIPLVQANLLG